jgi:translation initiation factor IF-2
MATIANTPRLLAAAKEFNIGKETLVEFLHSKGFEINAGNPNVKLTEEMYNSLQAEFAKDKLAKRKSDEIALPKGSLLDSLKPKKDVVETPPIVVKPKQEVTPAPAPKPEPAKEVKKAEPAPEPVKKEEPIAEEPQKTKEKKTTEKKAKEDPVVETPIDHPVAEEPKKETSKKKKESPHTEEDDSPEHIEVSAPKLGFKVLGNIDLDNIDNSTRPKKGAAKKKVEEPIKEEPKKKAKKKEDVTEEPKKTSKHKTDLPKEEATKKPVVEKTVPPPPPPPPPVQEEDIKPEHIEMKAPKLEGPKIIGRIELPTAAESNDSKEKRNRKRIPVQKKPETFKPDQNQTGDKRKDGQSGQRGGQQQGGQRSGQQQGGQRGGQQHGQRGGQQQGGQRGAQQQAGGRFDRNNRGAGDKRRDDRNTDSTQPEIDAKTIQEKIRQTQAKLAGSTKGKKDKAKYRRNKRDEMAERRAAEESATGNVIHVTEFISVSELASLMNVSFAEVIGKCMGLGIMVSINQRLDAEVIELVAEEFGYQVEFINLEQEAEGEEEIIDAEEDLLPRAPIVTIMGHVDHGKTSLLDYIRSANVVAGEAGGITQHIGAYQVTTGEGKKITFLDTPGHEAFTAMRARGAKVADIAVIVVAADDAIMPQTKEAISHAQAASLPMIFAINKIDKEGANPEKIKEQLAGMNILVEDWGGKFQSQEISAKKGLNIDLLLEKILLEAELLELKANPDRTGAGSVIEASLDKGRGYVATILVQNGTLEQGDMIVCGQYYGKIKAMFNERSQRVKEAGPSAPVQVLGLNGAPQAGEKFKVYDDETEAKEVATHRSQILREQGIRTRKHITLDEIGRRLALGNFKELAVIIKGDFDGSVEALSDSLQKLSTEEVAVNVVHKAVGQITESDVLLATASDAIIIGFQVRPSMQANRLAEQENIEIRTYSIIYDAIEEIKSAMEGLLEPKVERKTVANVEIREVFKISGVGSIAGCYVLDGKISRNSKVNLVRDGIVIYTGELSSLKRFKDDAKEVAAGYECGMAIKNYNDIRTGDIIEAFEEVSVKRTL